MKGRQGRFCAERSFAGNEGRSEAPAEGIKLGNEGFPPCCRPQDRLGLINARKARDDERNRRLIMERFRVESAGMPIPIDTLPYA